MSSMLSSTFFLALVLTGAVHAERVIGIADGDTMTVLPNGQPLNLRLGDINAPEKKQPFGQRSKRSLSELCWSKDASYNIQTTDKYGPTVARVVCNGVDVNRAQVERGMAWVYPKYNTDPSLPVIGRQAQA